MAVTNPITVGDITVLGSTLGAQVRAGLYTANFSMSTTQVSELNLDVSDPGFAIWSKGLYQLNQDVNVAGIALSIASVGTQDNNGLDAFNIKARSKFVRLLKQRQGALVMNNVSASQFVQAECKAVGARCIAETCQPRLQVARDVPAPTAGIVAVRPNPNPPSSWTTFGRLAQEQGFICFEADGTVYFGQPTWLIQHGENQTFVVDQTSSDINKRSLTVPKCTSNVDSTTGVSVSVDVLQGRARDVRPGFRFQIKGIAGFTSDYIVNSVSYPLDDPTSPCTVQAQTPIDPVPTLQMSGTGPLFDPTDPSGYSINLAGLTSISGSGVTIHGDQIQNAAIIVAVAKRVTQQQRDGAIGVETAMQESSLHNSTVATDHDSLGLFQQRPSQGWGTASQVTNPYYASNKFYEKESKVPNRLNLPMGQVAQTVQVSAFPDAYTKWDQLALNAAAALWPRITIMTKQVKSGLTTIGGPRHGTKSAADFVYWAQSRLGDKYIYAYPVNVSDINASIFDCSGLVEWAAGQVGISLPHQSEDQFALTNHIAIETAIRTRGALLWQPGHIAISLGNGKTIEAANPDVGVVNYNAENRGWGGGGTIKGMIY